MKDIADTEYLSLLNKMSTTVHCASQVSIPTLEVPCARVHVYETNLMLIPSVQSRTT